MTTPAFDPTTPDAALHADAVRQWAREYLRRGWSFFPLEPGEKLSVVYRKSDGTPKGYKKRDDGTLDLEQPWRMRWEEFQSRRPTLDEVEQWLVTWGPWIGLGVVTGTISGIYALDIDRKNGKDGVASLEQHHPETFATASLTQQTPSGGFHIIYALHEPVINHTDLLSGIDGRGEGGFITAEPAILTNGPYTWLRASLEHPLQPIPEWLRRGEKIRIDVTTGETVIRTGNDPGWVTQALLEGEHDGSRQTTAFKLACYFWGQGMQSPTALENLLVSYARLCRPPLDLAEVRHAVHNATRYQHDALRNGIIDPPECEQTLLGLTFHWRDKGISVAAANLVQGRQGTLVGLVTITTHLPAERKLYGPIHFDFVSQRDREGLVRACHQRLHGQFWPQLIDDMARLVIDVIGAGDPGGYVRDQAEQEGDGYLYQPFLIDRQPSLVFSPGSGGKTYLADALAIGLDSGQSIITGLPVQRQLRVGIFDWEQDGAEHKRRIKRLLGNNDARLAQCTVLYRNCRRQGPLAMQLEALKRFVVEQGIEYGIVDSAGPACGDPNDNATVIKFFADVNALFPGSLILAHVNRGEFMNRGAAEPDTPFGAIRWRDEARTMWYAKKVYEQRQGERYVMHLDLVHKKINSGPLHDRPFEVAFTFDNVARTTRIDRRGGEATGSVGAPAARVPVGATDDPVFAHLQQTAQPHSARELAEIVGLAPATVRASLARLERDRHVQPSRRDGELVYQASGEPA